MNNTFRIAELLNTVTAGYQRAELLANLRQGPDNLYLHVLARLADRWDQTPTTAQMHGATRSAIVRWHFTHGAADYWIIAKDPDISQSRAYGLASISYVHATPSRAIYPCPIFSQPVPSSISTGRPSRSRKSSAGASPDVNIVSLTRRLCR